MVASESRRMIEAMWYPGIAAKDLGPNEMSRLYPHYFLEVLGQFEGTESGLFFRICEKI